MNNPVHYLPPNQGLSYDWTNDHVFIKVSAEETGGAYTLVEDNLKPGFALGLHLHKTHAETFYVLEGSIDYYFEDSWHTALPGACLHIPAGVPHAARVTPGTGGARMLMVMQPSGFDAFLAELAKLTEAQMADADFMNALSEKHDIFSLGPVPE